MGDNLKIKFRILNKEKGLIVKKSIDFIFLDVNQDQDQAILEGPKDLVNKAIKESFCIHLKSS